MGANEAWVRTFFGKQKINPSAELDESMLQLLAEKTGGSDFRARSTDELEKIYTMIDKIEPIKIEKKIFRPRKALFYWPLCVGLFFVLIWIFVKYFRNKNY